MQRHNEVRDVISDLAGWAWNQITREPVIRNASESSSGPALIADLGVRGVWQSQAVALVDVCVTDKNTQSYRSHTPQSVLAIAESEKKRKYSTACEEKHVSFTPLCFSVEGLFGGEAKAFFKLLTERLASKWDKNYSVVLHWIRTRIAFALLRATDLCIRG